MTGLIKDQFSGLDMEQLIGGPLRAICNAQSMLAAATVKFIEDVGFEESTDAQEGESGIRKIRTAKFVFDRDVHEVNGEKTGQETVVMSVPLLSLAKIPSLETDEINISFDMEVKSSESSESANDKNSSADGNFNSGIGLFKAKVNIKGPIAGHDNNRRNTDNSAKYHVELRAKDGVTPEELAKMMDILTSEGTPKSVQYVPENVE